jgi:guanosine-3',5'-bis(diphosphate) 3'-pyrophosphohydrolase
MTQSILQQVIMAARFAADKHRFQRRKGVDQEPYINHPLELLNLLANDANVSDPVVLLGALLHDTVEDTETTFEELATIFGDDVAQVVREVTDDKSLPKATRKQQQIEHARHLSGRAKLIKLADKTSNLRDLAKSPPSDWSVERRVQYCQWSKAVIDEIRGTHPQLEHLFDQTYAAAYVACQTPPEPAHEP